MSRGTWVFLLAHKSDAFSKITSFYEYVKTQFDKKIKINRSDNALEFGDDHCLNFFDINGIIHQTSIADRQQQNGSVERKTYLK